MQLEEIFGEVEVVDRAKPGERCGLACEVYRTLKVCPFMEKWSTRPGKTCPKEGIVRISIEKAEG